MKLKNRSSLALPVMTVALVVITLLGLILSAAAKAQQPQVWIDNQARADTIVRPEKGKTLVFGFARSVVDATGIPAAAPARAYCTTAYRQGDLVAVDSVVSRTDFEMATCPVGQTPLLIRPRCELTVGEHFLYVVQKAQQAILFCGTPPEVYLLGSGGKRA